MNASPGTVLVTGAAGFIGRYLLTALSNTGYPMVAWEHRTPLPGELRRRCARVLSGDIRDQEIRREALRDIECVCHLAARIPNTIDDLGEAAACYQDNAQVALQLAEAAYSQGVRRFIHFSTANMYADSESPRNESDSVFPAVCAPAYFASKLAAELYLTHVARRTGMEVVILRVGTPYGPGEPRRKVIPTFLRLAAESGPLQVANGGCARFNFVWAADVAQCAVKALQAGPSGIYNVAAGEHTSLRELAQQVVELFEPRASIHIAPPAPGAFSGFAPLSIGKARQTWQFEPRTLAAGLREYRDFLASEGARRENSDLQ